MQNAETVLGVLRERGRKGLPLDELYRQLFNPQLYLLAYGRIYSNDGAMTSGVTQETVDEWLGGGDDSSKLKGVAASGGIVRGRARVVTTAEDLTAVEPGEILVCRITAPSWAPVFTKIAAAVITANTVIASVARYTAVRHGERNRKRIAEISVPA